MAVESYLYLYLYLAPLMCADMMMMMMFAPPAGLTKRAGMGMPDKETPGPEWENALREGVRRETSTSRP